MFIPSGEQIKDYLDNKKYHTLGIQFLTKDGEIRNTYYRGTELQDAIHWFNDLPIERTGTLLNCWIADLEEYFEELYE